MSDEEVKKAVEYGAVSNEIENNYLTKEEWNEILEAIKKDREKSFINEIVERVRSKNRGQSR